MNAMLIGLLAEVQSDQDRPDEIEDLVTDEQCYGVRMIDTPEGRNRASMLINKMYAWRGYAGTHKLTDDPNRITLSASSEGEVIGTLTLGIDSPIGLLADEMFKAEVDSVRGPGSKVCELTKLAFDAKAQSKEKLASLFHLAVIYARDLHHCTHIFIEVNPRHRRFYEHMLGFRRMGEPKTNARVNAPAYLLCVNLDYVSEQIVQHGGKGASSSGERSFYPLFYSRCEEVGIINRLKNLP